MDPMLVKIKFKLDNSTNVELSSVGKVLNIAYHIVQELKYTFTQNFLS